MGVRRAGNAGGWGGTRPAAASGRMATPAVGVHVYELRFKRIPIRAPPESRTVQCNRDPPAGGAAT